MISFDKKIQIKQAAKLFKFMQKMSVVSKLQTGVSILEIFNLRRDGSNIFGPEVKHDYQNQLPIINALEILEKNKYIRNIRLGRLYPNRPTVYYWPMVTHDKNLIHLISGLTPDKVYETVLNNIDVDRNQRFYDSSSDSVTLMTIANPTLDISKSQLYSKLLEIEQKVIE
jgi:hypothetical protein